MPLNCQARFAKSCSAQNGAGHTQPPENCIEFARRFTSRLVGAAVPQVEAAKTSEPRSTGRIIRLRWAHGKHWLEMWCRVAVVLSHSEHSRVLLLFDRLPSDQPPTVSPFHSRRSPRPNKSTPASECNAACSWRSATCATRPRRNGRAQCSERERWPNWARPRKARCTAVYKCTAPSCTTTAWTLRALKGAVSGSGTPHWRRWCKSGRPNTAIMPSWMQPNEQTVTCRAYIKSCSPTTAPMMRRSPNFVMNSPQSLLHRA